MSHEARDKSHEDAVASEQSLGRTPNDMNNDVAIKVTNVSKSFKLPHDKQNSIKGGLISLVKNGKRTYEKQEVLKDISFEIKKGEFFGIVGRNGSGKSTLLKMLAGIYTPTAGSIQVNGSLTPFIELGVGFNPELTGRENVFLNGALLGFNRKQMEAMYDDIVSFAEIERFMDQKLKNYSSGMQVRLAFSIAIRARSEILLIDEVLAVGDVDFQQKCYQYFDDLKANKRTIILVSHDMSAVKQFCDRSLLLSAGAITKIGTPEEVSREYERLNLSKNKTNSPESKDQETVNIEVYKDSEPVTGIESGDEVEVRVRWDEDLEVSNLGLLIYKNNELVFATNSFNTKDKFIVNNTAKIKVRMAIGDGRYKIRIGLFNAKSKRKPIGIFGNHSIVVFGSSKVNERGDEIEGMVQLETSWR